MKVERILQPLDFGTKHFEISDIFLFFLSALILWNVTNEVFIIKYCLNINKCNDTPAALISIARLTMNIKNYFRYISLCDNTTSGEAIWIFF